MNEIDEMQGKDYEVKIKDKTYQFKLLDVQELATFGAMQQANVKANAKTVGGDIIPTNVMEFAKNVGEITWYLWWTTVKKSIPGITEEKARNMPEAMTELVTAIAKANGLSGDVAKKALEGSHSENVSNLESQAKKTKEKKE